MTPQLHNKNSTSSPRNARIAGAAIIGLGLLILAGQLDLFQPNEFFALPALAAVFLAWGLLTRTFGLVIPGGILSGISLGAYLTQGPLVNAGEPASGGAFLMAFALGWVLIAALSPYTARAFQWWPLIPAGITAFIGALLVAGAAGLQVLQILG